MILCCPEFFLCRWYKQNDGEASTGTVSWLANLMQGLTVPEFLGSRNDYGNIILNP